MYEPIFIPWANLLLSLSDALDLASQEISQHQLRTSYIAWELAKAAKMSPQGIEELFIAALFHDIGALTPEEKIDLHKSEIFNPKPHTILGEMFLKQIPEFQSISRIVRFHHTNWQDMGKEQIDFQSQILSLADTLERSIDRGKYILHQSKDLILNIEALSNISPEAVELFKSIAAREDFWLDIVSPRLYSLLLREGPCRNKEIDIQYFTTISKMFQNLIDFRCMFTATHSSGVAATASQIAALSNFSETGIMFIEVAGNLHDLGKMAIPNSILTKPTNLTKEEFAIIQQHTYYTYTILRTIRGIESIVEWAAFHHERLNGTGYPFHLDAKKLSMGSRIMAVADIFTALAEDRPYRKGMGKNAILSILKSHAENNFLDRRFIEIIEKHYDDIVAETRKKQMEALNFYEETFGNKYRLKNNL
jgi:HD-GYP domain-containing protein (c-di-GMP phosphodiesterase class II)